MLLCCCVAGAVVVAVTEVSKPSQPSTVEEWMPLTPDKGFRGLDWSRNFWGIGVWKNMRGKRKMKICKIKKN